MLHTFGSIWGDKRYTPKKVETGTYQIKINLIDLELLTVQASVSFVCFYFNIYYFTMQTHSFCYFFICKHCCLLLLINILLTYHTFKVNTLNSRDTILSSFLLEDLCLCYKNTFCWWGKIIKLFNFFFFGNTKSLFIYLITIAHTHAFLLLSIKNYAWLLKIWTKTTVGKITMQNTTQHPNKLDI